MNISKKDYLFIIEQASTAKQISDNLFKLLGKIEASESYLSHSVNQQTFTQNDIDHSIRISKILNEKEDMDEKEIKAQNLAVKLSLIANADQNENVAFVDKTKIMEEKETLLTKFKGSTFRRKKNSWELRYRKNGMEKSFTALTQTECKKKLDDFLSEKTTCQIANKTRYLISVEDWYIKWLEVYKKPSVAESTLKSIKYLLEKNFIRKIGKTPIKKITPIMLQDIIYTMDAKGNSRHKLKNYINELFNDAYRNELIKKNVAEGLKDNALKSEEGVSMSESERAYLLNNTSNDKLLKYYQYILLTGCRRNEGLALHKCDVDRKNKTLTIRGTKTDGSLRTIPLFQEVENLIDSLGKIQGEKYFTFKPNFVTENASKYLPDGYTIKDLRTTFGTICNEKGINIKVIQKWMGHSSDAMTSKHYIKINAEYEAKEIKKYEQK